MIRILIDRLLKYSNPIKYWKKKGAKIGKGCVIFSSASLGGEPYLVTIGDNVRITTNVTFVTHDGGVWVLRNLRPELVDVDHFGPISIGDNVHIGNNAIIMPNVRIGNNCIIGVGAIVTKNIPDNSVAVGIPARVIETLDEYIEKNTDNLLHTKKCSDDEKRKILIDHFK